MTLEAKTYVPTLAVRASEMNGLEYLPGATKDRLSPCFLLAPWANSSALGRSIDRIERAFPSRPYFLDIDRDYQFTNLESEPQQELVRLLDPHNNYSNWSEFVADHEWVWPCIQSRGQSEIEVRRQIESFQNLGRTYCLRIVRERFPNNIVQLVSAISASGSADFVVLLEGGWTRDPLTLAAWFAGVISESLSTIDAEIPFVVSCTSIPHMFTEFSSEIPVAVPFSNRQLLAQIAASTNRARVVYGDWGSTRPRDAGGFASRPLDRVDYPISQAWYIARNKEQNWTFSDAASAIVESPAWDGGLGVWGEEMIFNTTINPEIGINTPQKNVAARVNIHLHRQAFFGAPPPNPSAFDEEWQD